MFGKLLLVSFITSHCNWDLRTKMFRMNSKIPINYKIFIKKTGQPTKLEILSFIRFHRLSIEYIVLKVRLILSSLQVISRGRQWSQSSWVAPSMSSSDPGNKGNRMKFGGPDFFRNSKTRTAPSETEATAGFLPSCGWTSACQPHMSWPWRYKFMKQELNSCLVIAMRRWSKSRSSGAQFRFFSRVRPE